MKTPFVIYVAAIAAVFFFTPNRAADSPSAESSPPETWTAYGGIVQFAARVELGNSTKVLRIFLKNISPVQLGLAGGPGGEFHIFTVDGDGAKHLFHDPTPPPPKKGATPQEIVEYRLRVELALSGSTKVHDLGPGETIVRSFDLDTADEALFKTSLVEFSFTIGDPKTGKFQTISTSPPNLMVSGVKPH